MCIKKIALAAIVVLYSGLSFGDCIFNGVSYPVGTLLGPYVCSDTGWVIRR